MTNMKKVNVDSDAIKKWCKANNMTLGELSITLGKGYSYMSGVAMKGEMTVNVYNLMCRLFSLPEGAFIKTETVAPPKKENVPTGTVTGYETKLDVFHDRLKMTMTYQGVTMYEAWAYIKTNTELGLVQAVSYAAHLLYKQAEQAELMDNDGR